MTPTGTLTRDSVEVALRDMQLLQFSVDRTEIFRGESTRLRWQLSEPAASVNGWFSVFLRNGQQVDPLPGLAGEIDVAPNATSTYTLEVRAFDYTVADGRDGPPPIIPEYSHRFTNAATIRVSERPAAPSPVLIPGGRVFGWEYNQGLAGYRLVAGKDTLVRVFVGATQDFLRRPGYDAGLGGMTLEFAELEITSPSGRRFVIPATMTTGFFANRAKSYSERDNVNFYVPGVQLNEVGTHRFFARWYRDGREIGGAVLTPAVFHQTRDLRLLIVVEDWPMSTRGWNAVDAALQMLNRTFPLRSGVGPMDGDQTRGLRVTILPEPLMTQRDNQGLVRASFLNDKLAEFNAGQASRGAVDRADRIMTVRLQQPNEPILTGVAVGTTASVVLNVDTAGALGELRALPGENYFGFVVGQEIGHTFGASYVNPPNAHSPNSELDEPTAFDVINRRRIVDPITMLGFVRPDGSTRSVLEVADWNGILDRLNGLDSTGPQ